VELKGKVSLVTGGAKRVGKSITLALAGRKSDVAITYLTSSAEASGTVKELRKLGVKALALQGDVSKKADVERIVATVEKDLGPIDVLVNNASIFEKTPWPGISEEQWDSLLDVNLKGPFLLAQILGPRMSERQRGKIINLVDGAGDRPYPAFIPYCVSKAGLISLTKALAIALAPHVQVNAIAPGAVLFPETASEHHKKSVLDSTLLGKEGTPEDIARTVLFLVEGTDFATGSVCYIDGGRFTV